MKRILICTGVLGGGTALVFAAAALAATLAPAGAPIPSGGQQIQVMRGWAPAGVGFGPLLVGNGGPINVAGSTTVNIAVDLPAIAPVPPAEPPVIVQPVGPEAP
jgi:hypothetical protein